MYIHKTLLNITVCLFHQSRVQTDQVWSITSPSASDPKRFLCLCVCHQEWRVRVQWRHRHHSGTPPLGSLDRSMGTRSVTYILKTNEPVAESSLRVSFVFQQRSTVKVCREPLCISYYHLYDGFKNNSFHTVACYMEATKVQLALVSSCMNVQYRERDEVKIQYYRAGERSVGKKLAGWDVTVFLCLGGDTVFCLCPQVKAAVCGSFLVLL